MDRFTFFKLGTVLRLHQSLPAAEGPYGAEVREGLGGQVPKLRGPRFPHSGPKISRFPRFSRISRDVPGIFHAFYGLFPTFYSSSEPRSRRSSWYLELIFRWKWPMIAAKMLTMGTVASMASVSFQLVTFQSRINMKLCIDLCIHVDF